MGAHRTAEKRIGLIEESPWRWRTGAMRVPGIVFASAELLPTSPAMVTAGPGLTNLVTALSGAYLESRELLVLGGQAGAMAGQADGGATYLHRPLGAQRG